MTATLVPVLNPNTMPDQPTSPKGDTALAAAVALLRRFATGQLTMPGNDSAQSDYLKAGFQLAACVDGFGLPGPQPRRGWQQPRSCSCSTTHARSRPTSTRRPEGSRPVSPR